MIVAYRILFVFIFILHAYSLPSIAKSSVSESDFLKNNDPVHRFYKSYLLSLIDNNDCRNIQVSITDSFLLDFPKAIDSDKGIYITDATPSTDIIFYNQGNNINQVDVSNVIMSSSPKDETKNSYFCVIYAVQSALYSKEKFDDLKKITSKLYDEFNTKGNSSYTDGVYTHSFSVDDARLIYKIKKQKKQHD